MKRVMRLTLAVFVATASFPSFAADGPISLWDQIWATITGQTTTAHTDDPAYCKAHPDECGSGFQ